MTEPTTHPTPPLRTWRPMVLWSAGIVLALGLIWFVAVVVVPVWQVRWVLRDFGDGEASSPRPWSAYIDQLGGPDRAAVRLGTYLRAPHSMTVKRYGAAKLLATCGRPSLPPLIEVLHDSDERIGRTAAYGLGKLGRDAKEAVPALEACLTSEDPYLRMEAASALYRIDPTSKSAVPALYAALKDPRNNVRMCALGQVAACGRDIALRPLIDALNDPPVRNYAAERLRSFRPLPDEAVANLGVALTDENFETRWCVASLIGDMGPRARKLVPDLERALEDKTQLVRTAAAEALKKIRGEEAKP